MKFNNYEEVFDISYCDWFDDIFASFTCDSQIEETGLVSVNVDMSVPSVNMYGVTFAVEQSLVFSSYLMRPHSAFRMLHLRAQSWIVVAVKFATGLVRPAQASNLNTTIIGEI